MRILNLFAGIGGNRTLWGNEHEITAVEHDQQLAMIYLKRFPNDVVIVGDAYEYFLNNFQYFDFIWASPPCQSHTGLVYGIVGNRYNGKKMKVKLPDFRLWGLISFLQKQYRGNWIVENVKPYYKPYIKPTTIIGRHFIWSNIIINKTSKFMEYIKWGNFQKGWEEGAKIKQIEPSLLDGLSKHKKKQIISNCINPNHGKYILDSIIKPKQMSLDVYNSEV